ncbi:protein kinase [Saccharomycopsis crataegensis]|uniref:non-specific serine/threonine protein kinase n=1 Tax=Saccharomycopsis crataegensis TaxID=43959 RepID=A0AAV5QJB6_9ASCO|nr:protein kinase [Saccharomycopsis crataegensis]
MPFKDIFHHKKDKDGNAKPSRSLTSIHLTNKSPSASSASSSASTSTSDPSLITSHSSDALERKLHSTKSALSISNLKKASTELNPKSHRKHSESISLGSINPFSKDKSRRATGDSDSHKQITTHHGALTHAPGKINLMMGNHNSPQGDEANVVTPTKDTPIIPKKQSSVNTTPKPLPSIDSVPKKKDSIIQYNPYGSNSIPSHYSYSSRPASQYNTTNHLTARISTAASVSEDKPRVLPLPIESPNSFLPQLLQQLHVDMYDEYVLPDSDSSKNRKLGDGASASVRVVLVRADKVSRALKKFVMFPREQPKYFYTRCSKEFVIAKALSPYEHIVTTYSLVKVPSIAEMTRGWGFVLELCPGGDLFSLIGRSGWKSTSNEEKFCIFKQICLAVKFMHDNDIAHRDLKPENVLLTDRGTVKLTDFGVSSFGHETHGDFASPIKLSTAYVGSPPYSPPEVMYFQSWNKKQKDDPNLPKYDSFKMDCWALGMLLFCMVYQGTPFQEASSSDSFYREFTSAYDAFLSKTPSFKQPGNYSVKGPGVEYKYGQAFKDSGASRVAWRLCDPDPKTRYTMKDLFSDPWFLNLEMCHEEYDEEVLMTRMKSHSCDAASLFDDESVPKSVLEAELTHGREVKREVPAQPSDPKKSMLDVGVSSGSTSSLPPPETKKSILNVGSSLHTNSLPDISEKNVESKPISPTITKKNNSSVTHTFESATAQAQASAMSPTKELFPVVEDEERSDNKDMDEIEKSLERIPIKDKSEPEIGISSQGESEAEGSAIESPAKACPTIAELIKELPTSKYCKGRIRKHHHTSISDITQNALGRGSQNYANGGYTSAAASYSAVGTHRMYSKV